MYRIKNSKRVRRRTDYIIITHVRNLVEHGKYIDPDMLRDSRIFTWGRLQQYFIEDLKKEMLPCHYFMERLDKDYVIYKGINEFQPSYFIEDLVSTGVLDYKYLNSILVVIGDDFSMNTMEDRWMRHLADKVLTGFLRTYKLDFNRIKYIDECLTDDWENNLNYSKIDYEYKPHQFFDIKLLKDYLDIYRKR